MSRFKDMLFLVNGTDGVEAGVDRTLALARRSGAALTMVDVLDGLPRHLLAVLPSVSADVLWELAVEETRKPLEALAERAERQDIRACAKVLRGKPSSILIQEVERGRHDLLIVNAKRNESLKEKVLGGDIVQLMRKCPCPVLAMRSTEGERSGTILAAVAPQIDDERRTGSSAAILAAAATLARAEGSKLVIAHFWNLAGEALLRTRARLPRFRMVGLLRGAHYSARASIEELLARVDLSEVDYTVHLRKGQPSGLIPELIDKMRVDLLVMGAPVRRGLAGFLVGNLAEEVFRQVECPIATVRSSGTPPSMESRAA